MIDSRTIVIENLSQCALCKNNQIQNKCGIKHLGFPLMALADPLFMPPLSGLWLEYWRSQCPFKVLLTK